MFSKKDSSFVYNEDVIKVLQKTPDQSVDMVYGDPDYNVGINYAGSNYTTKGIYIFICPKMS
jgi:DNA modification methylase